MIPDKRIRVDLCKINYIDPDKKILFKIDRDDTYEDKVYSYEKLIIS
jgi:hypothetical protein